MSLQETWTSSFIFKLMYIQHAMILFPTTKKQENIQATQKLCISQGYSSPYNAKTASVQNIMQILGTSKMMKTRKVKTMKKKMS